MNKCDCRTSTIVILLVLGRRSLSASCFCRQTDVFQPEKETSSVVTEEKSAPLALYEKLFGRPYTLHAQPLVHTPQTIIQIIADITSGYAAKWQKNELIHPEDIANKKNDKPSLATCDPQLLLFPLAEKHFLTEQDHLSAHGDLHGDALSLLSIICHWQKISAMDNNFVLKPNYKLVLFGDYTDRGSHVIETLELLAKLVKKNPKQIFLLRGNHETDNFGFKTTLEETFSKTKTPKIYADNIFRQWLQATIYFPQLLFFFQPQKNAKKQASVVCCMHGAPPAYSLYEEEDEINKILTLEAHCDAIATFLDDSTNTLNFMPSTKALGPTENITKSNIVPNAKWPYLWNYLRAIAKKNQNKSSKGVDETQYLGKQDIDWWRQMCSSDKHSITTILRSHQQSEQALFCQQNKYGYGEQFPNTPEEDGQTEPSCITLNIAPRTNLARKNEGFGETRADTYLEITDNHISPLYFSYATGEQIAQPDPKNNASFLSCPCTPPSNEGKTAKE